MNKVPERLLPGQGDWHFAGHQHLQRYDFATRFIEHGATLDWACGAGYGSYVLASASRMPVLGADIAEDALAYAHAHYRRDNLGYRRADALAGPVSAKAFSLVVSFETIEHVHDPARFLRNVHDSLAQDGRLLISAPNALLHSKHPTRPIQNEFHVSEPTYDELEAWLQPHFTVLRAWEQSPHIDYFSSETGVGAAAARQPANYAWVRALNGLENGLRRLLGRKLPLANPPGSSWPKRWAEIMPLLPERRATAHTFILLCAKR